MAYKVCEMSHYVKVGLVFVFIELLFHLNMMIHDGTGGASDTQHEEEDEEHVERGRRNPSQPSMLEPGRMPRVEMGSWCNRWKALEDECLAEAWKIVTFDTITSAQQTSSKY
jgi:hypothetical protein